jgi:hypothetical protein
LAANCREHDITQLRLLITRHHPTHDDTIPSRALV